MAEQIGINQLPKMKEGQNTNISEKFFEEFTLEQADKMKYILKSGRYIPQEILSEKNF